MDIAFQELLSPSSSDRMRFDQFEKLWYQYALHHPLQLFRDPPERKLSIELPCNALTSLRYFKPENCSLLLHPHPTQHLLRNAAGHAYDVNKMVVQLGLLVGRARLGWLVRHFAPANSGQCELCHGGEVDDRGHLLVHLCPRLTERAQSLQQLMRDISIQNFDWKQRRPNTLNTIVDDCSVLPPVILTAQSDPAIFGYLFHATRTNCYSFHRTITEIAWTIELKTP